MIPDPFLAGFAQFDVRLGETDANLNEAVRRLRELAEAGVRLAVLPEMWSCGFDNTRLAGHARRTPELLEAISRLAAETGMMIIGSMPEDASGEIFNTQYLLDADGTLQGAYRKIHLFTRTGEERFYAEGDRGVICDTALGRVGLMICYDLRFPELARLLAVNGAELIVVSAQWPVVRIDRWDILLRARAIENQVYLIGCNRWGMENNTRFSGHSAVIHPSGETLATADPDGPCIGYSLIDGGELAAVRRRMPCMAERRPNAYRL